ncbi:hypothetical protein DL766_007935 [Monosporascus sp. MC13-8B]|uniref:Tc1-like transposase DDE domain-containing protein n=1 Tax=Monosporascus cannonballus TaxID=155416 RepID=A0ABY0GY92_9PEZI|nr:hypothetical protein DL762_008846 [Monosporascus cannonballus]RYO81350.1 hypothetical protein DL763_008600 [Monosporascus cannonballus]RYP21426.1 hypothetical protein DL766_007935 [Monosporascus sp. MC13-8B]
MFWGGIRYGKRSFLVALDGDPEAARGGVTGRVYRDHLDEYLPECLDGDSIFMQDNAPVHTARIVKEWLQRQAVEVLEWPPYSPDLNPIENVWKLLKERIQKKEPKLRSLGNTQEALDLLIATAIAVWEKFAEGMLNDLIDSMPRRIEAVIAAQGWYTKY